MKLSGGNVKDFSLLFSGFQSWKEAIRCLCMLSVFPFKFNHMIAVQVDFSFLRPCFWAFKIHMYVALHHCFMLYNNYIVTQMLCYMLHYGYLKHASNLIMHYYVEGK